MCVCVCVQERGGACELMCRIGNAGMLGAVLSTLLFAQLERQDMYNAHVTLPVCE